MSIPAWAATNANSATKSRDAVPSIEFAVDPVKLSSRATSSGSRPRLWPASAPEPYGESDSTRRRQSASRSTSRSSAQAWASRWCDSSTGCACWRCVRPGMTGAEVGLGLAGQRIDQVEQQAADRERVVEQVAPEQGRDLVVAGPSRAQLAADVGADLLDQQSLEGAVHVLVGRVRYDGAGRDAVGEHVEPPVQLGLLRRR